VTIGGEFWLGEVTDLDTGWQGRGAFPGHRLKLMISSKRVNRARWPKQT